MKYTDFASKISFYEFFQDEFKPPHFNTEDYKKEIQLLKPDLTIEELSKKLGDVPRIFDIVEELFQLVHFTDAQYIHFCFDVNTLNNAEESLVYKYISNRVFRFENGKPNTNFLKIYQKLSDDYTKMDQLAVFYTKRTVIKYIKKLLDRTKSTNRRILYDHLQNSIETRLRTAIYIIENLSATDLLTAVDVKSFLRQKRHPIDTKGLHGRFGISKISRILQDAGFIDLTKKIDKKVLDAESAIDSSNEFSFIGEICVQGILKRSNQKLKKFDFVLMHRGLPKILIETNFYSTSGGGTKIGINENEYTALHADIQEFNRIHKTDLHFMWVTDGNYWLSSGGEGRLENLKAKYFKGPFELLNYNLLRESLPKIKEKIL
ncbi:MAG: DpnII family type II restriction endonuclease [Sedimentisphaerales bacterium]